jgi:integrase
VADIVKPEMADGDDNAYAAKAWTAEEATAFLKVAREHSLYTLFYLMLALGLRRGEVCGLCWANINLERQILRVVKTRICVDGKPQTSAPKTKKSRRSLKLPLEVIEVLKAHQQEQQAIHLEHEVTPTEDWLFTYDDGQPIRPDYVNQALERIALAAGVRKIRVHDLRHTYTSLARRAGVELEIVSEKLGHARSSFTADVYRHTFEDEHLAAAVSLSDLLAARPRAAA